MLKLDYAENIIMVSGDYNSSQRRYFLVNFTSTLRVERLDLPIVHSPESTNSEPVVKNKLSDRFRFFFQIMPPLYKHFIGIPEFQESLAPNCFSKFDREHAFSSLVRFWSM